MSDTSPYDDNFKEPREKWLAGYFSWVEPDHITPAELHTARDGFDAGANWQKKELVAKVKAKLEEHYKPGPHRSAAFAILSIMNDEPI